MSDRNEEVNHSAVDGDDWSVYQCAHGCVHVRIDRLTLTFNEPEFRRLVQMLAEARDRLATRKAMGPLRPH